VCLSFISCRSITTFQGQTVEQCQDPNPYVGRGWAGLAAQGEGTPSPALRVLSNQLDSVKGGMNR
jgi:hypothetical protein